MINVTDLTKYLFCPYGFYAEKVLKVKVPHTSEMVKGSIIHRIEEVIAKKDAGIVSLVTPEMSEREISELLYENWKRIIKREVLRRREDLETAGEDHISFIKGLKHSFRNEAIVRGIKMKEIIGREEFRLYETLTEERVEDEGLGLRGVVDRIEIIEGHHIPVEIKSGIPSLSKLHKLQLAAYVMLCERKYGEEIPFGFLFFTMLDDKIAIFLTEDLREDVLEIRNEVEKVLGGFIPERIRRKNCENCKYFNFCFGEE